MKYQLKLRIKFLLYYLLGIATMIIILIIAYLNNRLIETSITMILFFVFRGLFEKQYHCKSLLMCSFVSIIVFTIVSLLELKLSISILSSVIITFMINLISYYVRDYLDSRNQIIQYKNKFKKMHTKRIEELNEDELLKLFPDIRKEVIHITYEYLHRSKRITANAFAYNHSISEPLVYKYVKQVKDRYKNLIDE